MANLRTNNLSGEQGQNAYRGSVFFAGDASTRLDLDGSSDLAFGTGDFTIEMWIKIDDDTNTNTFYDSRPSGSNGDQVALFYSGSGNAVLFANNGTVRITGTTDVGKDHSWHHIALTRASGSTKLFVNGIQEGSTYSDSTDYANPSNRPRIGSSSGSTDLSATSAFQGYISNIRVQKGEALYTADFTPPTTELTANENTVLLCCQDSDNPLKEETGKTITGGGAYEHLNDTELVTNGSGLTTTGWTDAYTSTFTVEDGMIKATRSGGSGYTAYQTITTETGQQYTVSVNIQYGSGNYSDLRVLDGGTPSGSSTMLTFLRSTSSSTDGKKSTTFTAASTSTTLVFTFDDGGDTGKFSQISVKAADRGKQPEVIPPYGVDAGNTFGGSIQQSSQGYMYFPTGRKEERGRGRVVIAGGTGNSPYTPYMTRIDFFNITTTGNTLLFGDLSFGSRTPKGMVSSTTRAVYAGGMGPSSEVATNSMSFITIATQGNGTDYGDLTAAGRQSEGCSNNTRGIYFSGQNDSPSPGTNNNIIDFITTASTGNATDFGDQTNGRDGGGACQSTTRGIYAGGDPSPYVNIIDFITIATAGNAQDFGDLSFARTGSTGCSNSVRGLFMSGRVAPTNYNTIEFITIATTGNSEDFGDLSYVRIQASAAANKTRGVLIGGNPGSSPYNFTEMSQVTIDSTGNATNFGDCFAARTRGSVSDSHGGLS